MESVCLYELIMHMKATFPGMLEAVEEDAVPLPGVVTVDDEAADERIYSNSSSSSRSSPENDMPATPLVMVGSRVEMLYDVDVWYKATVTQLHAGEEFERGVGVQVITVQFDCDESECKISYPGGEGEGGEAGEVRLERAQQQEEQLQEQPQQHRVQQPPQRREKHDYSILEQQINEHAERRQRDINKAAEAESASAAASACCPCAHKHPSAQNRMPYI
jgi:hypothetical protein